jgi:hypothetical protein
MKTTEKGPQPPQPLAVMLLFVGGFLAGVAFMLFPFWLNEASRNFLKQPAAQLWVEVIGFQVAVWFTLATSVWTSFRSLWRYRIGNERRILWSIVFFLIVLGSPVAVTLVARVRGEAAFSPLQFHTLKLTLLTLIATTISVPAVLAIFLINAAIRKDLSEGPPNQPQIRRFLELQGTLQRLRNILGTMIGLAVLALGALRNAVAPTGSAASEAGRLPVEQVWTYGLFFTVLVALVYVPTYLHLISAGRRIRDELCPFPEATAASIASYQQSRKPLDDFLQLQLTATESLKAGVAILAPLAGAVASLLLGTTIKA